MHRHMRACMHAHTRQASLPGGSVPVSKLAATDRWLKELNDWLQLAGRVPAMLVVSRARETRAGNAPGAAYSEAPSTQTN